MRNLFFLLVLFSTSSIAQEGINYQGVATNISGTELINQNISVQISIISDSATGSVQWQETHLTTTDQFGLFNIVIGQGTISGLPLSSSFEELEWGSGNHYLKVEMDATGGNNYSLISTTQMMSVPYALFAKKSRIDSSQILSIVNSTNTPKFFIECVDMGVSLICGGLGLDPSANLNANNISYNTTLNGSNYINEPHWRKYKLHGLNSNYSDDLMFVSGDGTEFVFQPLNDNGQIFFYMYATYTQTACGGTVLNDCASSSNIGISIPTSNGVQALSYSSYCHNSYHSSYNDFEIFYKYNNNWINSNIFLRR